jgi:hypothetical protein
MLVRRGWIRLLNYSSWLLSVLSAEVDDTQENFWSQCYEVLALLGR